MSGAVRLGKLDVSLDRQGLRLSMADPRERVAVKPVLCFEYQRKEKSALPIAIHSLTEVAGGIVFVGALEGAIELRGSLSLDLSTEGLRGTLLVKNVSGEIIDGAVRATIILQEEAEPRWMVPGFYYGGTMRQPGSAVFPLFDELREKPEEFTSRRWAIGSDRPAIPAIFCWTLGIFAWVSCDEVIAEEDHPDRHYGITGLHFGLKAGEPALGFDLPYRESPVKITPALADPQPGTDEFLMLQNDRPVGVRFCVGMGRPDLHAYAAVIQGLWSDASRDFPQRAVVSPEDALRLSYSGLLRWHGSSSGSALVDRLPLYHPIGVTPAPAVMRLGSGLQGALALLMAARRHDHQEAVDAARGIIDFATSHLAPCGTLFPAWMDGSGWCSSEAPSAGHAHSRTVAEAVYWLLKAIEFEREAGHSHPEWEAAADRSLRYAVGANRNNGSFPTYFDLETGTPHDFEGDGGIAWMAACALGSKVLGQDFLREVACTAAIHYAERIRDEALLGSSESYPGAPTADDAAWAVIGFLALYDVEGEKLHLALARRAADLALTWRRITNTPLPPLSVAGRYGMRARGGTVDSVACPHTTTKGLLIYNELRRLSSLLGNEYYRQRADEALLFAHQFIVQQDGQFNGRMGMVLDAMCCVEFDLPKGSLSPESSAYGSALIQMAEMARHEVRQSDAEVVDIRVEDKELRRLRSPEMFPTMSGSRVELPKVVGIKTPPEKKDLESSFGEATASLAGLLGLSVDTPRPRQSSTSSAVIPKLKSDPTPAPATPTGAGVQRTPVPVRPKRPNSTPMPPPRRDESNDDIEIKYKIF